MDSQQVRGFGREQALRAALTKRAAGVPSYTIPEAAALCSVSQEHLYRLVRAGAFPAVRMRRGGEQGRYVVPAAAVEALFAWSAAQTEPVEVASWSQGWPDGGAA